MLLNYYYICKKIFDKYSCVVVFGGGGMFEFCGVFVFGLFLLLLLLLFFGEGVCDRCLLVVVIHKY